MARPAIAGMLVVGGFALAVAVATAYVTAADYLVMPTRSGFCHQAIPSCPPLAPGTVHVFEPNWLNGVLLAGLLVVVTASLWLRLAPQKRPPRE